VQDLWYPSSEVNSSVWDTEKWAENSNKESRCQQMVYVGIIGPL